MYTEAFNSLIKRSSEIESSTVFLLRKDNTKKIKVFPDEIKEIVLQKYFSALESITEGKEFVDFIPDEIQKETLQVIPTEVIPLWEKIKDSKDNLRAVHTEDIVVNDYDCDGNVILVEILLNTNEYIYFLTTYSNVSAWYSNNVRFTKNPRGKFIEEEGKILALTPYVDVVIHGNRCYIINERNFNKIFKFDKVIENHVLENESEIKAMEFISDGDEFMKLLCDSKQAKGSMSKIITQNRLQKMRRFHPTYIKEQIVAHPELSNVQFDNEDKIIIDKDSFKVVMKILRGTINLDLITKELNGVD